MLLGTGSLTRSSDRDVIAAPGEEGEPKERGAPTPLEEKVTSPSSPRPPSSSPTFSLSERRDFIIWLILVHDVFPHRGLDMGTTIEGIKIWIIF